MLAGLVSIDKIAVAGRRRERQRAAARGDDPLEDAPTRSGPTRSSSWSQDKQVEVAREAAVGLGKIGSDKATQPLVDALTKADKDSREKFLAGAPRRHRHATGLVLALKTRAAHDRPRREKFQTKQLFDMMRELEDPRGGDALYAYIQTNPKPHWKFEAAHAHGGDRRRPRGRSRSAGA